MATTIRFKNRSLIRRFGSDPVEVSESLAKQYTDRGQAIYVRERLAKKKEKEEETPPEVSEGEEQEETPEEETEEVEEEEIEDTEDKIEVKIKKKK